MHKNQKKKAGEILEVEMDGNYVFSESNSEESHKLKSLLTTLNKY